MASKTPAALLDEAVEAIWLELRAARPDDVANLTWRSALADKIGNLICAKLPFVSIQGDARHADLLLAASNACPVGLGAHLDIGLAIAARALYRRAFIINVESPDDVLVRFDVLLVHIREGWISEDEDLIWFVSQLRRQFVAVSMHPPAPAPHSPPRPPQDEKHRLILELITGGASLDEPVA